MTSLEFAAQLIGSGHSDRAIEYLQIEADRDPGNGAVWKLLGTALHEEQFEPESVSALERARSLLPEDAEVAMALAQSCLHAGYNAIRAFVNVMRLEPYNLDALRGYALAVTAAGDSEEAVNALSAALKDHPSWIEGHKLLASLRHTAGDTKGFTDSYARACSSRPDDQALHLAWFHSLAQVHDWDRVKAIVDSGIKRFGLNNQWQLASLFLASETGDDTTAEHLFEQTRTIDDVGRDLACVRFNLRTGNYRLVEQLCDKRVKTEAASMFWPYMALVWRLTGDSRLEWLESGNEFVEAQDITFTGDEIDELATCLRSLHIASNPFAGQSVRQGTQTDQNLFLRHEPEIRSLRQKICHAVGRYVGKLPEQDLLHPLLRHDRRDTLRGRVHFSGSWSVRLGAQGYNVPHTHPMGWISAALYMSLPSKTQMGAAPAGWIQFGTAPKELGLGLDVTKRVEPKVSRMLLFPSTTWHSTVPFNDGERLVVAFDVMPPKRQKQVFPRGGSSKHEYK